ncbi:MAG: type II secretion system F family protein, partial [Nitrososphaerota archaeon]|nr:type II secretion system F family protein [Nitrososphaerota archaeon]
MLRASAGKVYFGVLALASTVVLVLSVRDISPLSGTYSGLALGFVLGDAVLLVGFSCLLFLLRADFDSKVTSTAILEVLGRGNIIRVRRVREDRAVWIARSIPLLNRLAERMERGIRGDVVKGGMQLDPYAFAAKYSFYSVVLAAVFVPVSLALSVLVSPTLLALMMIPAIILYTPSLSAKNRVSERKTNVKDELPFFALLASITQSSGRSLIDAFRGTVGKHILPAMEAEARLLQKSIGFGKDIAGALDDLASTHPDDSFKHFLYGYTGVLKSGGDVVLYLSDRTRE